MRARSAGAAGRRDEREAESMRRGGRERADRAYRGYTPAYQTPDEWRTTESRRSGGGLLECRVKAQLLSAGFGSAKRLVFTLQLH